MPRFIDNPPPPEQRIQELHVWVAIQRDGSEGIVSTDLDFGLGRRHMPLMSSQYEVAARMNKLVEAIAVGARAAEDPPLRYELRSFQLAGVTRP